jgi:hypothetical protein
MSRTVVISDDAYRSLQQLAARQGEPLEVVLEALIEAALPDAAPGGTDELLRRMGMSDAEIAAAKADPDED